MGSGKGNPEGWVAVVKPGATFELSGVPQRGEALAGHKLPVKNEVRDAGGRSLMKASELRDLSEGRLREHIATARRDLFGLRMESATGELDNTARLSGAKRDLARALTVARQRGEQYVPVR